VILEVSGEGAMIALFAGDLLRMYTATPNAAAGRARFSMKS